MTSLEESDQVARMGPGDRLIVRFTRSLTGDEVAEFKRQVEHAGFDPNTFVVISGADALVVVDADACA